MTKQTKEQFIEEMKSSQVPNPWNPSAQSIRRVRNPLPVPTECPYCKGPVELCHNSKVYGKTYGDWPWMYRCEDFQCDAFVGLHPGTDIPLGTLAQKSLRNVRQHAKSLFNPLWRDKRTRLFDRTEAYAWLAGQLGMDEVEKCHIGWFDIVTCIKVINICRDKIAERK